MIITEHNYGSLLPSEDEIIAQGRDFAEHEKTCNELAAILFPVINELRNKVKEMEANRIKYANTNIYLINDNVELMWLCKDLSNATKGILDNDGGEGSKRYSAVKLWEARTTAKELIAKADRRCQTSGNPF